jgi:hypothetical protein
MKKELMAVIVLLAVVDFASGFWTGRTFPAHHYEHLFPRSETASNAVYLFDAANGRVCSAWKPFQNQADKYASAHRKVASPNGQDVANTKAADLWQQTLDQLAAEDAKEAADAAARNAMTYIPPCGE